MRRLDSSELQAVTGIILPGRWDHAGRLVEVEIFGSDGTQYVLKGDRVDHEFFKLCHYRLRVEGVSAMEGKRHVFTVSRFEILGDKLDCGYDNRFDFTGSGFDLW